mmetsp:Transcript_14486/g.57748  ORF Transcript_14486/g.57748 Transcript_14486/m.57748 type:complete len:368 (+) Transcript_14486:2122-3225(+)
MLSSGVRDDDDDRLAGCDELLPVVLAAEASADGGGGVVVGASLTFATWGAAPATAAPAAAAAAADACLFLRLRGGRGLRGLAELSFNEPPNGSPLCSARLPTSDPVVARLQPRPSDAPHDDDTSPWLDVGESSRAFVNGASPEGTPANAFGAAALGGLACPPRLSSSAQPSSSWSRRRLVVWPPPAGSRAVEEGASAAVGGTKRSSRQYSKSATVDAASESSLLTARLIVAVPTENSDCVSSSRLLLRTLSGNTDAPFVLSSAAARSRCSSGSTWSGAGDSRRASGCHSIRLKNACCLSASTPPTSNMVAFVEPRRLGTWRSSSPRRHATPVAEKLGDGNLTFSVKILRCKSLTSFAANGGFPASIS